MPGFVKKCPFLRQKIEEEVRVLDYRHSSLQDIPTEVFNRERTLEELFADSNQIRDLPRELFYCHGLRKLSISDNEITSIPPAISSLSNLEELDFSKNGIIDVPDNIKGCKYLRSIDASVNPLGKLPEGITHLTNLTHLYLNDTFLDYLPGSFGRMVTLKILELRENHLKTLPHSFSRLVELERLDIGNNELSELSDVIGGLRSLLELWCDKNQITTIAHNIGNLKQLMFLDASNNQLQELPVEIEGCVSLADLHLTTNNITVLPDSIGNLTNLTTLKVDDNQLTSLPKNLGGLSSLSEFNVSANDLEELPGSIGLLRNLRTFYADENNLRFIPAEMGSCCGVTVLSLRGNKLTYVPDELGRIPRLRVLNLSDNLLRHLPFSIVKLKELQALWLAENQTRPLIPLQSEYETGTGRKILTCYLLPQGQMERNDERDCMGDSESFHASMWDEERLRKQQIHFDFADGSDEEGTLVRCPTPYPKEMREKVRHARNLALRQMINVGDREGQHDHGTVGGSGSMDRSAHVAVTFDEVGQKNFACSKIPEHCDMRVRETRVTKPTSPSLQETHRLFKYDKEKLMKDKVRMQHRMSVPDFASDVRVLLKDNKNKDKKGHVTTPGEASLSRYSGSVPDLTTASGGEVTPVTTNLATSSSPQSQPYNDLYAKQIAYRHRGRRSRRMKEYDSDTGYRSDGETLRFPREAMNKYARETNSEIVSVQSHPLPYHNHHQHRGREGIGYASDIEGYAGGGTFPTANAAAAAFQRKQDLLGHLPAQSLPYNLDTAAQSQTAIMSNSSRNFFSYSPLKSEPRQPTSRRNSDLTLQRGRTNNPSDRGSTSNYTTTSTHHTAGYTNSATSNDETYRHIPGNDYYPSPNRRGSNACDTATINHFSSSQSQTGLAHSIAMGTSFQTHLSSGPTMQTPLNHSQKQNTFGLQAQTSISLGPHPQPSNRPNLHSLAERNMSLQPPQHSSTPSQPVFHKDNYLDQNTPNLSQTMPSSAGVSATQNSISLKGHRVDQLYTVIEQRQVSQQFLPSHTPPLGQPVATPPPYTSTPPYRRPENRSPVSRTNIPSSDSSSSRVDSPHSVSNTPRSVTSVSPLGLPNVNFSRTQSSPCGFHGSKPYSDLPATTRERLTFSDYVDIDNLSQGDVHNDDLDEPSSTDPYQYRRTSRSGSNSSHLGSASQVGPPVYPGAGLGSRRHDQSNSSDSRSDIHNYSSSRESPYSRVAPYGSAQTISRQDRLYDHYSGPFDVANYEDLTVIPNQEQSSQVSSSTDSGYGHGHHMYDSIGDYSRSAGKSYPVRGHPGSHTSEVTTFPQPQRQMPAKISDNIQSREITPVKDILTTVHDSSIQEYTDQFRVTIYKNPGLGFSVAGGIGSHGNPYKENDIGIFVTKVIPDGPASKQLQPGDKILEVNQVDFQAIEHNQAVTVLKTSSSVDLLVERVQKVNLV